MPRGLDAASRSDIRPSDTKTQESAQQASTPPIDPATSTGEPDQSHPTPSHGLAVPQNTPQRPKSPAYLQGKNPYGKILERKEHAPPEPQPQSDGGPPSQVGSSIDGRPRTTGAIKFTTRPERPVSAPAAQKPISPPRQPPKAVSVKAARSIFETKATESGRGAPPSHPATAPVAKGATAGLRARYQTPQTAAQRGPNDEETGPTRGSRHTYGRSRLQQSPESSLPIPRPPPAPVKRIDPSQRTTPFVRHKQEEQGPEIPLSSEAAQESAGEGSLPKHQPASQSTDSPIAAIDQQPKPAASSPPGAQGHPRGDSPRPPEEPSEEATYLAYNPLEIAAPSNPDKPPLSTDTPAEEPGRSKGASDPSSPEETVRRPPNHRFVTATETKRHVAQEDPKGAEKRQRAEADRDFRSGASGRQLKKVTIDPKPEEGVGRKGHKDWRAESQRASQDSLDIGRGRSKRQSSGSEYLSSPSEAESKKPAAAKLDQARFRNFARQSDGAGDEMEGLGHDGPSSNHNVDHDHSDNATVPIGDVGVEDNYFDILVPDDIDLRIAYGRRKTQDFGFPGARIKPARTYVSTKPLQTPGNWIKRICGHFSSIQKTENWEDASKRPCRQCLAKDTLQPTVTVKRISKHRRALTGPSASSHDSHEPSLERREDNLATDLMETINDILTEHTSTLQHVINNLQSREPGLSRLHTLSEELVRRCDEDRFTSTPRPPTRTSRPRSRRQYSSCDRFSHPPYQHACHPIYQPVCQPCKYAPSPYPYVPPRAAEKLNVGKPGLVDPNLNDAHASLRERTQSLVELIRLINSAADDLGIDLDNKPTVQDDERFRNAPEDDHHGEEYGYEPGTEPEYEPGTEAEYEPGPEPEYEVGDEYGHGLEPQYDDPDYTETPRLHSAGEEEMSRRGRKQTGAGERFGSLETYVTQESDNKRNASASEESTEVPEVQPTTSRTLRRTKASTYAPSRAPTVSILPLETTSNSPSISFLDLKQPWLEPEAPPVPEHVEGGESTQSPPFSKVAVVQGSPIEPRHIQKESKLAQVFEMPSTTPPVFRSRTGSLLPLSQVVTEALETFSPELLPRVPSPAYVPDKDEVVADSPPTFQGGSPESILRRPATRRGTERIPSPEAAIRRVTTRQRNERTPSHEADVPGEHEAVAGSPPVFQEQSPLERQIPSGTSTRRPTRVDRQYTRQPTLPIRKATRIPTQIANAPEPVQRQLLEEGILGILTPSPESTNTPDSLVPMLPVIEKRVLTDTSKKPDEVEPQSTVTIQGSTSACFVIAESDMEPLVRWITTGRQTLPSPDVPENGTGRALQSPRKEREQSTVDERSQTRSRSPINISGREDDPNEHPDVESMPTLVEQQSGLDEFPNSSPVSEAPPLPSRLTDTRRPTEMIREGTVLERNPTFSMEDDIGMTKDTLEVPNLEAEPGMFPDLESPFNPNFEPIIRRTTTLDIVPDLDTGLEPATWVSTMPSRQSTHLLEEHMGYPDMNWTEPTISATRPGKYTRTSQWSSEAVRGISVADDNDPQTLEEGVPDLEKQATIVSRRATGASRKAAQLDRQPTRVTTVQAGEDQVAGGRAAEDVPALLSSPQEQLPQLPSRIPTRRRSTRRENEGEGVHKEPVAYYTPEPTPQISSGQPTFTGYERRSTQTKQAAETSPKITFQSDIRHRVEERQPGLPVEESPEEETEKARGDLSRQNKSPLPLANEHLDVEIPDAPGKKTRGKRHRKSKARQRKTNSPPEIATPPILARSAAAQPPEPTKETKRYFGWRGKSKEKLDHERNSLQQSRLFEPPGRDLSAIPFPAAAPEPAPRSAPGGTQQRQRYHAAAPRYAPVYPSPRKSDLYLRYEPVYVRKEDYYPRLAATTAVRRVQSDAFPRYQPQTPRAGYVRPTSYQDVYSRPTPPRAGDAYPRRPLYRYDDGRPLFGQPRPRQEVTTGNQTSAQPLRGQAPEPSVRQFRQEPNSRDQTKTYARPQAPSNIRGPQNDEEPFLPRQDPPDPTRIGSRPPEVSTVPLAQNATRKSSRRKQRPRKVEIGAVVDSEEYFWDGRSEPQLPPENQRFDYRPSGGDGTSGERPSDGITRVPGEGATIVCDETGAANIEAISAFSHTQAARRSLGQKSEEGTAATGLSPRPIPTRRTDASRLSSLFGEGPRTQGAFSASGSRNLSTALERRRRESSRLASSTAVSILRRESSFPARAPTFSSKTREPDRRVSLPTPDPRARLSDTDPTHRRPASVPAWAPTFSSQARQTSKSIPDPRTRLSDSDQSLRKGKSARTNTGPSTREGSRPGISETETPARPGDAGHVRPAGEAPGPTQSGPRTLNPQRVPTYPGRQSTPMGARQTMDASRHHSFPVSANRNGAVSRRMRPANSKRTSSEGVQRASSLLLRDFDVDAARVSPESPAQAKEKKVWNWLPWLGNKKSKGSTAVQVEDRGEWVGGDAGVRDSGGGGRQSGKGRKWSWNLWDKG